MNQEFDENRKAGAAQEPSSAAVESQSASTEAIAVAAARTPSKTPDGASVSAQGEEMVRIRVKERTRLKSGKGASAGKLRRPRLRTVVVAVSCVVLVLLLCGTAGFAYMRQQGEQNMVVAPASQEDLTATDNGKEYVFNDNVVAVLFEGIDDESSYSSKSCSDANFLLTMDTSTNDVTLTVVPRDSLCNVDVYQSGEYFSTVQSNLCLAYAQDADKETCAKNVAASVSSILGDVPIKYYFAMNVHAIETLASAVDGVTVTALQTIPDTSIVKGKKISLTGQEAYKYVQYRDTSVAESALDRQKRQKQFIKALFKKAKAMNATQLVNVVQTVSEYSVTNIGASELTYLASVFLAGGKGNVDFNTITGTTKTKVYEEDGLEHEYIVLDKKSVKKAKLAAFYAKVGD